MIFAFLAAQGAVSMLVLCNSAFVVLTRDRSVCPMGHPSVALLPVWSADTAADQEAAFEAPSRRRGETLDGDILVNQVQL